RGRAGTLGQRLGAAGDGVVGVARLDGVVAGPRSARVSGVLAGRGGVAGDRDRLRLARDEVLALAGQDRVVAGEIRAGGLVDRLGLGLAVRRRLRVAGDGVVAGAGGDLVIAGEVAVVALGGVVRQRIAGRAGLEAARLGVA